MTKTKRIFYFVPSIYPCGRGGMEIYYNFLIDKFSEIRAVGLFTACENYTNPKIRVVYFKRSLLNLPGTRRFYSLLAGFAAILKSRKEIELIHIPYTAFAGKWGYVFVILHFFFKLEYVLMIHGGGMLPWKKLDGSRVFFKYAKSVIAVSELVQQEYESRSKRDISIIYPLVPFVKCKNSKEEIRNQLGISKESFLIIFIGSLKKIKNPSTLIEAVSLFEHDFLEANKIKVLLIGDGEEFNSLNKLVQTKALQQYVTLMGHQKYENISRFYRSADLYVIPSIFEGTSKSLLEAMFNKLPIIASDVQGINNVLKNNYDCLYTIPGDALDLNTKIKMIVEGSVNIKNLGINAYNTFDKKYSYSQMIEKLVNIYQGKDSV